MSVSERTAGELVLNNVSKTYAPRRFGDAPVHAVEGVSLRVKPGGALGLVGESGSGKTTLARLITGVERPTAGAIEFEGVRVDGLGRRALREYRAHVQMVFQDPYAALNPLHTVRYTLERPLRNYLRLSGRETRTHVHRLLETVGLVPVEQFEAKLPHQLSGGQLQRTVIARALASRPRLIVADEPVSMLDVSLRAGILQLLDELRTQMGMSLLYITHDLLSARVATEEVLVLHRGRVVEHGRTIDVLRRPQHAYTKALVAAVPSPFERAA
ncbi:MAG TPA: ATP-binding cassette domain-containing protein [Gaiellaceae bacterium]|nr:ATP-binding cassette domain-containing protein [Gaiellaceae bacterium]